MTRTRAGIAAAFALLLATALGGCGGSTAGKTAPTTAAKGSTTPSASRSATGATESQSLASSAPPSVRPTPSVLVIHIRNFAYVPPAPAVLVGQRIEIINDDTAAHTWSAAPKSNWTYNSGNLEKGQRVTFSGFTKPGRYPFLCYYHADMPSMNGTITVK